MYGGSVWGGMGRVYRESVWGESMGGMGGGADVYSIVSLMERSGVYRQL